MAKLHFLYGAMNSGKTTDLLNTAHNYERHGKKVIVAKPLVDTKGGITIIARNENISPRPADILISPEADIKEEVILMRQLGQKAISCVLVDEAQFLTTKNVESLHNIVVDENIPVMAWGLRTNSDTELFEGSKRLVELASRIEEVRTVCECDKLAIFNARKVNGVFVQGGSTIAIDGEDGVSYESLCPKCYKLHVGSVALSSTVSSVEVSNG